MSNNHLKRTCRRLGLERWPYRKVASLQGLRASIQQDGGMPETQKQVRGGEFQMEMFAVSRGLRAERCGSTGVQGLHTARVRSMRVCLPSKTMSSTLGTWQEERRHPSSLHQVLWHVMLSDAGDAPAALIFDFPSAGAAAAHRGGPAARHCKPQRQGEGPRI